MVIITNGQQAVITYSESQWLDAAGSAFPATYQGFRVSGNPSIGSILGSPELVQPDESGTQKIVSATTEPMSAAEVEGLGWMSLFWPALLNRRRTVRSTRRSGLIGNSS